MSSRTLSRSLDRRSLIRLAAATGAAQLAAPFVVTARAADEIKFGLNDPLTGTYAELGKNEQIGCQLAIEQINSKGGVLGRKAQLLVEDSTSADTGIAVQKARKLIERDKVDFFLGNVNSAMAIALGEVSNELKKLHIVTGGHTDSVTGTGPIAASQAVPLNFKNSGKVSEIDVNVGDKVKAARYNSIRHGASSLDVLERLLLRARIAPL